jgi:hypothetical protein
MDDVMELAVSVADHRHRRACRRCSLQPEAVSASEVSPLAQCPAGGWEQVTHKDCLAD